MAFYGSIFFPKIAKNGRFIMTALFEISSIPRDAAKHGLWES